MNELPTHSLPSIFDDGDIYDLVAKDTTIEKIRAIITPRYKYLRNYLTDRPYMQPSYKRPSVPHIRLCYAWALGRHGEFHRALEQIEQLRSIYEQLTNTDVTVLWIHGLPPLSQTVEIALELFRGIGESFDVAGWLDSLAAKLDDDGRNYLRAVKARRSEIS